jgi:hypothetical protein
MNKSKSLILFLYRYNKVTLNIGYSGFYTEDITLTGDLENYLIYNGLYFRCTNRVTVLRRGEIKMVTVLKDYIPKDIL